MPRARGLGPKGRNLFDQASRGDEKRQEAIEKYFNLLVGPPGPPPNGIPGIYGDENPIYGPDAAEGLPDKVENYYHGPAQSTRVIWSKFVMTDRENQTGQVYVRFRKKNNKYKYGTDDPIPLSTYYQFRGATSKGQRVRMLEPFGYQRDSADSDNMFSDMPARPWQTRSGKWRSDGES